MFKVKTTKAKLGLIQVTSDYGWTVEQCIEEILTLMERCLQEGADLVFAPEEAQYKGATKASRKELVEKHSAGYLARCRELARKYEAYVLPWDYELAEDGRVYNTTYVIDRKGQDIGKYRKVQMTRGELSKGLSGGDDYAVFDLDIGKVGIMICMDNYYPESAAVLAHRGAELILYPLYGDTLTGRWETRTRARAIDHTVYVAPCHIHSSPRETGASYTGLIDPEGEVVARLTEEGTHQVVEVEMGRQVITQMSGVGQGVYEDTKQYVRFMRNSVPFAPVAGPVEKWPWEQVRWRESN